MKTKSVNNEDRMKLINDVSKLGRQYYELAQSSSLNAMRNLKDRNLQETAHGYIYKHDACYSMSSVIIDIINKHWPM